MNAKAMFSSHPGPDFAQEDDLITHLFGRDMVVLDAVVFVCQYGFARGSE
jgi:hypothetical protein